MGLNLQWNDATSTNFTLGTATLLHWMMYVAYLFAHDDQRFGENEDESIIYEWHYEGMVVQKKLH